MNFQLRALLLLVLVGLATLAVMCGCATPGAPLPPSLAVPKPVEDLTAQRKGSRVLLSWPPSMQTTDRQNIRHFGPTFICRAANQFPMDYCVDLVKKLNPTEQATGAGENAKRVVFEDVLPNSLLKRGSYATYTVQVFNDRGRSGGMSNQVRVSLAPTLRAPQNVLVTVTQNGVQIQWTGDPAMVSSPSSYNYKIYRRAVGEQQFALVQEVPAAPELVTAADNNFEWEKTYEYKVVPVTELTSGHGAEIEGEDSPIVKAFVHDSFAPAQPVGVQAVFSGPGQKPFIDLSWSPSTASDFAGYNVFRHTQGQQSIKINTEPVRAPSFRDEKIIPGTTYFYSVSAFDFRGNESARSEETNESVPDSRK